MKKSLLFVFCLSIFAMSCELYDERVLPIVGIYQGQVVGVSPPFKFNISAKSGDRLLLDAPLDGDIWDVITLDIDNKDNPRMRVTIPTQTLEEGVSVKGSGFYLDGTIQLNYTINVYGERRSFKLVGQQW
ncbi:MAG TPA: hypothetical protein PKD85_19520 [Saprospiraceae bacterium]|nr:hypothetical protein [Saprospiraceae bacterium]